MKNKDIITVLDDILDSKNSITTAVYSEIQSLRTKLKEESRYIEWDDLDFNQAYKHNDNSLSVITIIDKDANAITIGDECYTLHDFNMEFKPYNKESNDI